MQTCAKCGTVLSAAVGDLCPHCLFDLARRPAADSRAAASATAARSPRSKRTPSSSKRRRARRFVILIVALLFPAAARAQQDVDASDPRVEAGVDVAATATFDFSHIGVAPRLTLAASSRLSLDVFGEIHAARANDALERRELRTIGAQIRSAIIERSTFRVDAVGGLADDRLHRVGMYGVVRGADGIYRPTTADVIEHTSAFIVGIASSQRVHARLSIREQASMVLGRTGPRLLTTVGVAVPIERYRAPERDAPVYVGAFAVHAGQRVWIRTHEGSPIEGVVRRTRRGVIDVASDSGTKTIAAVDVDWMAVPDSVKNGLVKGVITAVVPTALLMTAFAQSCDCAPSARADLAIFGSTATLGGLAGVFIDSLAMHPQTVYGSGANEPRLRVRPFVHRRGPGILSIISWR
jgi:hypothetical protein